MSLSKSFKHCRTTLNLTKRHFTSGDSDTTGTRRLAFKGMSITQWKLLTQFKDYYLRYNSDKSMYQVVNNQFTKLLQKIQPSIYGDHLIRPIETRNLVDSKNTDKGNDGKQTEDGKQKQQELQQTTQPSTESQEPQPQPQPQQQQNSLMPRVLTGWQLKIGSKTNETSPVAKPKWLSTNTTVVKQEILSRTNNLTSLIMESQSDESRIKRIEDLSEHLLTFPEAKHQAIKEGAIRLLLRIQENIQDAEAGAAIRESLAILGHVNPLPMGGIRILSIDGGGTRGLLVIEMLKKFEELTGKRIHELFDLVCGVSTGAIITCAIGAIQKDLPNLAKYYKELSTKIFSQSTFWGTSNLVFSHSYYDTKVWEKFLQEYFGDLDLIKTARNVHSPKMTAVSAVVNQAKTQTYVFRNYSLPYNVQSEYMGGTNNKVWEAVRASSSAPTYFEECKLGDLLHQDGGIMANNPTGVAIHEARLLWPSSKIQCIVSFGTGRTNPIYQTNEPVESGNSSSWKNKFMKILDSATDTERVHTMLNDLLPPNVYYRFNPYLTEMVELVENRPEKLAQLERDALMYLHRNDDKFKSAAKKLMEPRTPVQKVVDWLKLKQEVYGVSVP